MTNPSYSLPQEAVKAAAREVYRDPTRSNRVTAQVAIHAFLEAMEVTVEYQSVDVWPGGPTTREKAERRRDYHRKRSGGVPDARIEQRLSPSRWFPIKGPVDE